MSDKFKIIDHATFEKMQQSSSRVTAASSAPKIRNSKYKRISAKNNFNLMHFVKSEYGQRCGKKGKMVKRVIDTRIVDKGNKGKKRENGIKKNPTRLKKSILQYRQKNREQAQVERQLIESLNEVENLAICDDRENEKRNVPSMHSSTFREYCNCCKTPDLKKYCEQLIRELNHFQRRAHALNEIKARAHKRFVVGFRQVQAYLRINKIKLVIIATDCERNEGDVSLDETIESIKVICNDHKIPVVFAFRRRQMAYFIYKKASISCIGILDYDGARDIFLQLMESLENAREMYETLHLNN